MRSARGARGKAECVGDWQAWLVEQTRVRGGGFTLFVAADDLRFVLPRASAALAPFNVTVVSRLDADESANALLRVHSDVELAHLALDIAAMMKAEVLWPAPRSGLSVHLMALRACEREGHQCDPALAACVSFTSSGCGGTFPNELLTPLDICRGPRTRSERRGRYKCERRYECPEGSSPPDARKCESNETGRGF